MEGVTRKQLELIIAAILTAGGGKADEFVGDTITRYQDILAMLREEQIEKDSKGKVV